MASRRVVLPWSTWPMIVTTGGLGRRSAGLGLGPELRFLLDGEELDVGAQGPGQRLDVGHVHEVVGREDEPAVPELVEEVLELHLHPLGDVLDEQAFPEDELRADLGRSGRLRPVSWEAWRPAMGLAGLGAGVSGRGRGAGRHRRCGPWGRRHRSCGRRHGPWGRGHGLAAGAAGFGGRRGGGRLRGRGAAGVGGGRRRLRCRGAGLAGRAPASRAASRASPGPQA